MTRAKLMRIAELTARARSVKAARDEALADLRARLDALRGMAHWAEIDSGAQIEVGTEVRYLLRTYRCTQGHAKSLLRAPTNAAYWVLVEDDA